MHLYLNPGFLIDAFLVSLVFIQANLAHEDSFLTVRQMQKKGFDQGLPFLWHLGMWGDLFVVSSICKHIVNDFHDSWSWWQMVCIAMASILATWFCGNMWDKGSLPESHTYYGRKTAAGKCHMLFMAIALTIIGLFYFATPHNLISEGYVGVVSSLLSIHVFVGTHSLLKIWNPKWFGIPFTFKEMAPWAAVTVALGILTWRIVA